MIAKKTTFDLGTLDSHSGERSLPFGLLVIKYYMYTAKRLSQRLSLVTFLNKIKHFHKLEQYTATKNNCLDKLERKWFKYNEALQSIH